MDKHHNVNYFWVNQGVNFDNELKDEILCSPQKDKGGRDKYRLMRDLHVGDLIINYKKSEIVAYSEVREKAFINENGDYEVKVTYNLLEKPIKKEEFKRRLGSIEKVQKILLNIKKCPFDKNFNIKQGGYLFNINKEIFDLIFNNNPISNFNHHKNQILYGPPGTGKTYNTIIKAMEIINNAKYDSVDNKQYEELKKDFDTLKQQGQIEFVTFHQSYSYEEFVEGIKPSTNCGQIEYKIENGIFKEMCIKANSDPENNYVLIIDEINRGNISKIFGELITLIEEDKRIKSNGVNDIDDLDLNLDDTSKTENSIIVKLPYSQMNFGVPNNLYILGTMNTSDRSIASIDIALRRRFKFIEMMPKSELVADFGCGFQTIFEKLNTKIKILLDRDHQIGHSYFINTKYANADINTLKEIWFSEIIPLLNEYFYCDWEKLKLVIPGFIKEINIPEELKNECEDSMYEFNTPDDVQDFLEALNQDKFKQEN